MWIARKINADKNTAEAERAEVLTGGREPSLQGGGMPDYIHPYGFESLIPSGERAAVLGGSILGIGGINADIEAGEVMISSMGGAYILLKNDGRVIINGQSFEPETA